MSAATTEQVFTAADGSAVRVSERVLPHGGRHVTMALNDQAQRKLEHVQRRLSAWSYEASPEAYEREAEAAMREAVPELAAACARVRDADIVEVRGMPVGAELPETPRDGVVVERDVRAHVSNLVTVFMALGLRGCAYSSENEGRLLRAVAPVAACATQASSQGFTADLAFHQDTAHREMPLRRGQGGARGPMNTAQGFVCGRPDDKTPMELLTLTDLLADLRRYHGREIVEEMHRPDFAIHTPISHGGVGELAGVPLLASDDHGRVHGRISLANARGLTGPAQAALDACARVVATTSAVIPVRPEPGTVLVYSNLRVLHRRSRYAAKLDGRDRYYIRLYGMDAAILQDHAGICAGRVLP